MPRKASPKPKTDGKPTELKTDRFQRLALSRVSRALKVIYNIGNLGGPGYESSQEQRDKIINALTEAVTSVDTRLNKQTSKPTGFSL